MGPYLIFHPFTIYGYEFAEYLHNIGYSFSYFYICIDPLVLILFYKKFRINWKLILNKIITEK